MSSRDFDVVAIGHGLVDIRFIVDKFPGPDEEASIIKQSRSVGGSAANVAIDVSRLGGRSAVILKVGLDDFGRMIINELMREKVDVSGVKVCLGETGFTVVVIDKDGRIIMYGFKGAAEKLEPDEVDEKIIRRGRFLHIASLRLDTSIRAAGIAKEHGLTVSWDPGRRLSLRGIDYFSEFLKYVDIVLVNRIEAYNLTGIDEPLEAAKKITSYGPQIVVVKMGAKGILLYDKSSDKYFTLPAFPVKKVIDTTGAGDAFAAGFLLGLSRGYTIRKAAIYGNAVAALKVSRLGSHNIPGHEEVVRYIWDHSGETF